MKIRKIEIVSDLAHFKKPFATKIHYTYTIPPISTVIGIMQNLFNDEINNFIFGYLFEADPNIFKDINKVYKEVNFNIKNDADRYNSNGEWVSDIAEIHYLVNPKLTIYTSLTNKLEIREPLTLGKTDCLSRVVRDTWLDMKDIYSKGFNQFTALEVGTGKPMRISTLTQYNESKGYYEIYKKQVRLSDSFKHNKNYDEEVDQCIFLWKYEGGGSISEYR